MGPNTSGTPRLLRAWYHGSIDEFRIASPDAILGTLAENSEFDLRLEQRDAWRVQIEFLRSRLDGLNGDIFFEFSIPRMGRRADVILLISGVIFVVEFKVYAAAFDTSAIDQVWDYALDLKNFHAASHEPPIVPILVATDAPSGALARLQKDPDGVFRPVAVNRATFRDAIDLALRESEGTRMNGESWASAPYRPTPTIIEAARALYAQHSVEEIARHDADAKNLGVTSRHIENLVAEAKAKNRKMILFVTGVPGAGKTLVGMNVATRQQDAEGAAPAVYLSGNTPLVDVLREALARDEFRRKTEAGETFRKGVIRETIKAFIQNVHHYRDEALRDYTSAPAEHVAIFDEAQRAWTLEKTKAWLRQKKGIASFDQSEAEFLISTVDRHTDWGVVVCLVGGGQEIGSGEAGIDAWLQAANSSFPGWEMHISSRLTDSEYAAGHALDAVRGLANVCLDDSLHLAVSMRSFRAENVSGFVKALLDRDEREAAAAYERLAERYPIVVTRDLDAAKEWTRGRSRGSERYGLVTSSKAMRLKPHAIDVRAKIDPVNWFLEGKDDTRSSFYLEDAATEFQVQGLELDWTCVTWDADLRINRTGWGYHDFKGSRWENVNDLERRKYLLNAYRVLLTRARQGMVIFLPPGSPSDPTRPPEFYAGTADYLRAIGLPFLS